MQRPGALDHQVLPISFALQSSIFCGVAGGWPLMCEGCEGPRSRRDRGPSQALYTLLSRPKSPLSCIPILKAPNDDSFVVAEDLNEFMLIFSVPLCISLMGPRAVRETEGQGPGAEVPWRRTKKPHRWAFRRS